jgi:hypothetical protein
MQKHNNIQEKNKETLLEAWCENKADKMQQNMGKS